MFELDGYIYRFYRNYNERGQKVNYECHITTAYPKENLVTTGQARLNPKDKFDKRIGKLIALKNALDSLEVGRAVNKKVMAKFEEEYAKRRI